MSDNLPHMDYRQHRRAGKPETVCRLRGGLCPQIQPGKILPRLRRAHEAFQTRINQGFFRGCQRVRDTFILFPRKRRFNA